MQPQKIERYRLKLLKMRERITGEAEHLVQSIQEDINPSGNLSGVPIHLADIATEAIDADVHVLETERGMLDDIEAALARINDGTFGKCEECQSKIAEERLDAIPFAPLCIKCAQNSHQPVGRAWARAGNQAEAS